MYRVSMRRVLSILLVYLLDPELVNKIYYYNVKYIIMLF